MQREIPWFDSSDKQFEEMYYFRWYAWKKHFLHTPQATSSPSGSHRPSLTDFGALPDAAPFHIGEARWLRDHSIADDDARYWSRPASTRANTVRLCHRVRDLTLATRRPALGIHCFPR